MENKKFQIFGIGDRVLIISGQVLSLEGLVVICNGICEVTGIIEVSEDFRKWFKEEHPEEDELHPQMVKISLPFASGYMKKEFTVPGNNIIKK